MIVRMSKSNARELAIERLRGYIGEHPAHKRSSADIAYDIVDLASDYPDFCRGKKSQYLPKSGTSPRS